MTAGLVARRGLVFCHAFAGVFCLPLQPQDIKLIITLSLGLVADELKTCILGRLFLVVLLIIRIVAHQQACNIFLLKLIARVTLSTLKSGSVAITLELDNCLLLATIGLFERVFSSV